MVFAQTCAYCATSCVIPVTGVPSSCRTSAGTVTHRPVAGLVDEVVTLAGRDVDRSGERRAVWRDEPLRRLRACGRASRTRARVRGRRLQAAIAELTGTVEAPAPHHAGVVDRARVT